MMLMRTQTLLLISLRRLYNRAVKIIKKLKLCLDANYLRDGLIRNALSRAKRQSRTALRRYQNNKNPDNLANYLQFKSVYKSVCRRKRLEFTHNKVKKLESSVNNSKSFWR